MTVNKKNKPDKKKGPAKPKKKPVGKSKPAPKRKAVAEAAEIKTPEQAGQEAGKAANAYLIAELEKLNSGIPKLAAVFKEGLNAQKTQTLKVKGALKRPPKGFRIIGVTGILNHDHEDGLVAGDGETILQWEERDTGQRVATAKIVTGIFDAEPVKRVEVGGTIEHDLTGRLEKALEMKKKNHGKPGKKTD